MKRKILSVLAVFIAVIITATALTACNKTPAGAESSGGSGESMSTGQGDEPSARENAAESGEDGELYEFVASEKAAAQVQGIAEVLGGYDFVGLSGVQST